MASLFFLHVTIVTSYIVAQPSKYITGGTWSAPAAGDQTGFPVHGTGTTWACKA